MEYSLQFFYFFSATPQWAIAHARTTYGHYRLFVDSTSGPFQIHSTAAQQHSIDRSIGTYSTVMGYGEVL